MVELAFGLPAAGAMIVAAFRDRGLAVLLGFVLGLAGLIALVLAHAGSTGSFLGLPIGLTAPAQVVVAATFAAAGFAVLLVPPGADRAPMLASVLAGLAARPTTRLAGLLPGLAGPGSAGVLLALAIFNVLIGAAGGWRARELADVWRYSFVGDWGLVLVGFGLLNASGSGAAYLLLLGILLLRLPLYLLARPALVLGRPADALRPLTLMVGAALFGTAPFLGFPA